MDEVEAEKIEPVFGCVKIKSEGDQFALTTAGSLGRGGAIPPFGRTNDRRAVHRGVALDGDRTRTTGALCRSPRR